MRAVALRYTRQALTASPAIRREKSPDAPLDAAQQETGTLRDIVAHAWPGRCRSRVAFGFGVVKIGVTVAATEPAASLAGAGKNIFVRRCRSAAGGERKQAGD